MNKKEIITTYSQELDITTMFENTYKDNELTKQELVGFYYGLPSKQNNIEYYRDLVAEFDW